MSRLQRWWCALRGHAWGIRVGRRLVWLECAVCEAQTPGWVVAGKDRGE